MSRRSTQYGLGRRGFACASAHGRAVGLVRSRHGPERRAVASPSDDATTDERPQGIPTSAIRAGVVSAGWNAHHPGSCDKGHPWGTAPRRIAPGGRARASAYLLFASRDEGRTGSRDPGTGGTRGSLHDAALHALESGGDRGRDSVVGQAARRSESRGKWRHSGHAIDENGKQLRQKVLVERATGIEPVSEAWEASVLPLY